MKVLSVFNVEFKGNIMTSIYKQQDTDQDKQTHNAGYHYTLHTHCLLLLGSGACNMKPYLHPLGACLATSAEQLFSLTAPCRLCVQ